jgi:hypothetical protein
MNSDAREIPDSWKDRRIFYFEATWLTDSMPDEFNHDYVVTKSLREIAKNFQAGYMLKEKDRFWLPSVVAKRINEPDFHKFYFEILHSLEFDSYLEFDYEILKRRSSNNFNFPFIPKSSRDQIKEDIKFLFSDNLSKKYYKKELEFGNFILEFKTGTTQWSDRIRRKYFESDNPIFSLIDRYCYVTFTLPDVLGNLRNKDIDEGRLKIQGNTIICGEWKYTFENEKFIYGVAFGAAQFYSDEPIGMFEIAVCEDEEGTRYENGERYEPIRKNI